MLWTNKISNLFKTLFTVRVIFSFPFMSFDQKSLLGSIYDHFVHVLKSIYNFGGEGNILRVLNMFILYPVSFWFVYFNLY